MIYKGLILEENIILLTAENINNSTLNNVALTSELRGVLLRSYGTHQVAPVKFNYNTELGLKRLDGFLILADNIDLSKLKLLASEFKQDSLILSDNNRLTTKISLNDDNTQNIGKLVSETKEIALKQDFFIEQRFFGTDFFYILVDNNVKQ